MKWLIIGPQTRAARAQELLAGAGIASQRKKLTTVGEGCMHAVGISDFAYKRASAILEEAGIRIKTETAD